MSALTSNLTMRDPHRRYNVLKNYFTAGFSYKEICNFVFRFHRIKITIRHLNCLLRQCNLQRRGNHSNINTVIKFIQDELKGCSSCFGYQYMLQKLRSSGLTADKETIRLILKSLDPVGVDKRKRRKLKRREYHSFDPTHIWHIDGYDKLKPFEIAIHGAIDRSSRRILWLKLSSSNNNPEVIANYYLCCVKELNVIPRVVRGDHGTETVIVSGIQRFFCRNHTDSQSKEVVKLQDIVKKDDLKYRSDRAKMLVNIHHLVFFLRDIHNGYLSLEKTDNKQSNFVNELKNFEKGTKTLEKRSFLDNLGLLFSAREKLLDNFQSRLFPMKKLDKIPTLQPTSEPAAEPATEPAAEPTPEVATEPATNPTKQKKSKLKLQQELINEIIANEKDEIFWNYFNYQNSLFLAKSLSRATQAKNVNDALVDLKNAIFPRISF